MSVDLRYLVGFPAKVRTPSPQNENKDDGAEDGIGKPALGMFPQVGKHSDLLHTQWHIAGQNSRRQQLLQGFHSKSALGVPTPARNRLMGSP